MEAQTMIQDLKKARIMLVDDEAINIKLLEKMLGGAGYPNLIPVQDSRSVIALYQKERPDLILLDLNMPFMNGYQVMEALKELADPLLPPIIVLTAQKGREYLLARVSTMIELHSVHLYIYARNQSLDALVRERTEELLRTRLQVVQRLGRASEYRDNETGKHIIRVSFTAALLAEKLGWSKAECEILLHATPMHDLGKIGIPDAILLKPGKLEDDEWEIMKTHTAIGAHILEGEDSELLKTAREISLAHHERWDGTGYPRGLAGEDIPQSGRIVALADVFDALTSHRPYKEAWTIEAATAYMLANSGTHFDPFLVPIFRDSLTDILAIRDAHADPT